MAHVADGHGLRRWLFSRLPLVAVATVLLAALLLMTDVQRETSHLNQLSLWIFGLTGVALIGLLLAIISQGVQLYRKVRQRAPGARMSRRLILVMFGLALPPVLIVYFFSLEFLDETIDGWFDVDTDQALQQSLEIGQMFLDLRVLEAQEAARDLATDLVLSDEAEWFDLLLNRLSSRGPVELAVLSSAGDTITSVNIRSATLIADRPDDFTLLQAADSGSYTAAEPSANGGLKIRALEQLPQRLAGQTPRLLQAIYPVPEDFSRRANQVEQAYYRYQTASYLRQALKQSFVLILTLVLVLTVLLAMLLGFGASRRLVRPLTELTAATRDIAAGRFDHRVTVSGDDEVAFLGDAFNRMAADLQAGRSALEAERRNLEILLARLSAGVLAINADGTVS
ncbi:MAG TPA: HAMP domain-containing protein, partial [Kiloniellaceae bacterium]|nr:HAMP domain-containing protein [Kiloniellaceae bacterium]